MIRCGPLLVLALTGCAPGPVRDARGGPGGGIVSTNPCADAILIELVPPGRIAAISRYSKSPADSSIAPDIAARFPGTAGTAEEVIALDPSLVLTSSFTPLATRAAYERAGLKTLVLSSPSSVEESKAQVMRIATAVGAVERVKALNARIDAALSQAAPASVRFERRGERVPGEAEARRAERSRLRSTCVSTSLDTNGGGGTTDNDREVCRPSALLYIWGDLATGEGTLLDDLLTRTGFRDAAAGYGLHATGRLPIETIAADPPDVILTPDAEARTATLRRRVLARTGARTLDARFARRLVNCGGPTIIPAVARLAAIRRSL